jgi:hypothetical protein
MGHLIEAHVCAGLKSSHLPYRADPGGRLSCLAARDAFSPRFDPAERVIRRIVSRDFKRA